MAAVILLIWKGHASSDLNMKGRRSTDMPLLNASKVANTTDMCSQHGFEVVKLEI